MDRKQEQLLGIRAFLYSLNANGIMHGDSVGLRCAAIRAMRDTYLMTLEEATVFVDRSFRLDGWAAWHHLG